MKLTLAAARVLRLLLDRPWYGLELSAELTLATGTVFPLLARMEATGLVVSEMERIDPRIAERPARRYYQLTPAGRDYAVSVLASLSDQLRPPAVAATRAEGIS